MNLSIGYILNCLETRIFEGRFDWAESFSDDYKGLAKVTKNDKEFYIDRFGNYVKDAD